MLELSGDIVDLVDSMNLEQAVQINIDQLDEDASNGAAKILNDITALYYDKEWAAKHPQIKRRLDVELESLRNLVKMRKADEQVHDALLSGISANNSNASLYKALADIQRTSLAVTKQIDETVTRLENMLKSFQLSIDFEEQPEENKEDSPSNLCRGSKEFINKLLQEEKKELD